MKTLPRRTFLFGLPAAAALPAFAATAPSEPLSFVFLRSDMRENLKGRVDEKIPGRVWQEMLNSASPDRVETSEIRTESPIYAGSRLVSQNRTGFPAYIAFFNDAAAAKSFHANLSRLVERSGAGYALVEGAQIHRNGEVRKLGFQA